MLVSRLLPADPVRSLAEYESIGGGVALAQAREVEPAVLIDEVAASGLRGRGGGGFPTGEKWRTVAENASDVVAASVVVNGAEGEPGTFKDRVLLMADPYAVLEGALIAARAVGAGEVTIAVRASFTDVADRVRSAIAELDAAGWTDGIPVRLVETPERYLVGEETALLEVLAGRPPLPRTAPPYRRGAVDVIATAPPDAADDGSATTAVVMAGDGAGDLAPPALVNNVETLANVPAIIAKSAAWFREVGTERAPGSILVTVSGAATRHGVHEVALGTTLADVLELAGGPPAGVEIRGVLGGVSANFLTDLSTPIDYESMSAAGSALGSASFQFVGADVDPTALAAGVSWFLAAESCAQCTPCKVDGLTIADGLARLGRNEGTEADVTLVHDKLATVADGARCALGRQHQEVVGSILAAFPDALDAHLRGAAAAVTPVTVGPIITVADDRAQVDVEAMALDPDWSGLQADVATVDEPPETELPVDPRPPE